MKTQEDHQLFYKKFEPDSSYPNNIHPAGEKSFILEGEICLGPDQLNAGEFLYAQPGKTYSVFSLTGCALLLVIPEEVEIL